MRKFYSPSLTFFFAVSIFLATGASHIYSEDLVFEPIENSDTCSSIYLESPVNVNCTVTFVNEGGLDRVLCKYDSDGARSDETDIDSGQTVTKDVSDCQIWQIWDKEDEEKIEEWTISCSGVSSRYYFGNSGDGDNGEGEECCQSHGDDYDHINGFYSRHVGRKNPANYSEDRVFEPIENNDTSNSLYLESRVNANCNVTFVNEGGLDRVLWKYDSDSGWSDETNIESGQTVIKNVSDGQIWQIWDTEDEEQIEEWTISCSGGSSEYSFGNSDCCQSHGDHDHISGLYLRYVGPTSPATIEFSTEGYSNTSYSGTHSFDDFILIEADPNASGYNNRFGTNSNFTVNGLTFACHTSCSNPTNVGDGISSNGNFVSNPNPNASDIMFIIEGIATAEDGWCGENTNTCGTLDGVYIHDSSDGTVVYGPINNGDNLILTQTILPDFYYLDAHVSGNIESISWIVDNESFTDNEAAYSFPEDGIWSAGLGSHNIIVNSFSQDNSQGDNCGSLDISFDFIEDCDLDLSVSSTPNSVCDGGNDNGGDEECCQSHGDDHDHISGLYLRYVGPTSPATIEFSTEGYSNTTYTGVHSLNDFILIEADPNASGYGNRFGTNSQFTVNGFSFDCHTSCSQPTNVGDGISSNGDFVPNPDPNASDIMFIIEGIATPEDGWCGDQNTSGSCNGSAIANVTLGQAPFTYLWSNGQTTQEATGLCAGIYSVTVTAENGCLSTYDLEVTDDTNGPEATLEVSENTVCDGEGSGDDSNNCLCEDGLSTVTFVYTGTSGILGGAYDYHDNTLGQWTLQNGESYTFNFDNANHDQWHEHNNPQFWTQEGDWVLHGTLDSSCDSPVIDEVFGPFTVVGYTDLEENNCSTETPGPSCDGTIDLTVISGSAPYTYLWSNGSTNQDLSGLCAGEYSVVITDSNGCSSTYSVNVSCEELCVFPEANASATQASCIDQTGTITFNFSDSSDRTNIEFSIDGGVTYPYNYSDVIGSAAITGIAPGLYDIWVRWGNDECPLDIEDVTITLIDTDGPVVTCPNDVILNCTDVISTEFNTWLDGFSFSGGSEPINETYTVTLDGQNISYPPTLPSNVCAGATIIISYSVTDACDQNEECSSTFILTPDTTAPVVEELPENLTIECGDEESMYIAVWSDNCSNVNVVTTVTELGTETADCGQFRTQTPGGWGAPANGNNSGMFRDVNFDLAFPNTLVVGCETTLTLTSPSDVESFLPSGGIPSILFENLTNPDGYENSLAGHLVAITLTLRFDELFEGFGESEQLLKNQIFIGGPFNGWRIEDIVITANEVFGGCNTTYSPSQMVETLSSINENYVDGEIDNGDVLCTDSSEECPQTYVYSYIASDECGNTTTVSRTITIVDTTPPEIICAEDETLECVAQFDFPQPSVDDNCSDVTITFVDSTSPIECGEYFTRTWTATDLCGNFNSCSQTITLVDTNPTIIDVADYSLEGCTGDWPTLTTTWTDNCSTGGDLIAVAGDVSTLGCSQSRVYTFTVSDDCGNDAIATTLVSRTYDVTPPVMICPEDMEHECDESPIYGEATATDACNDVTLTSVESEDSDNCITVITRTWTATDLCGNSSSCIQTITIVDTSAPEFTNLPEAEIELLCQDELPEVPEVTVTDNCDELIEVVFVEEFNGFNPDPEADTNCEGVQPLNAQADWAMSLFGLPNSGGESNYNVVFSQVNTYEDMGNGEEAIITGTFYDQANPNGGWHVNIHLVNGVNWADWSSIPGNIYKDDYDLAGDSYEDWIYYIIDSNGAYMEGWGDFEGSYLEIAHIPFNLSVGWQYGVGANNVGPNLGLGGWLYYEGLYIDSSQGINQAVSGAGDIAVDLDCCPTYLVTRIWSAIDCAGNESTFSQEITVLGTDAQAAFSCLGDFDFDGNRSTADLGILLGNYGCFSGNCICDLNGDGFTTSNDVSIFLALFGQPCDNANQD